MELQHCTLTTMELSFEYLESERAASAAHCDGDVRRSRWCHKRSCLPYTSRSICSEPALSNNSGCHRGSKLLSSSKPCWLCWVLLEHFSTAQHWALPYMSILCALQLRSTVGLLDHRRSTRSKDLRCFMSQLKSTLNNVTVHWRWQQMPIRLTFTRREQISV